MTRFEVDRPDLAFVIHGELTRDGGRMVCQRLTIERRPGGPPVTGEALRRIQVQALVRAETRRSLASVLVGDPRQAAVAGPIDDTLRLVAEVYRIAYLCSDPPTATVAGRFGLPRSTAGRWVAMARARGFLGEVTERKAGI